jgi:tetratricopeptide (TPR) repeat protein
MVFCFSLQAACFFRDIMMDQITLYIYLTAGTRIKFMNEPFRKFHLTLFLSFSRFKLLPCFLIALLFSPLQARVQDSAALFSSLYNSNEHERLIALQKVYEGYYRFFPVKARPYTLQSLYLSKKLNDGKAEAGAYYAISYYYACKGMIDSSFYFGMAGLNLSRSISSVPLIARGYGRMGEVYRTKGDKVKAIEYLKKAIELDTTNQDNIANNCQSLGILYGDAGCPDRSVWYYLKALKIREKQKKLIEAGYLYCNLAGFYFQPPYKDQGFNLVEMAIGLFRQENFPKGESYADNMIGMAYIDRMDYRNALKYFRRSLALNTLDTLTIRSGYSFNLTNIGDVWLKMNRFDSAEYYYLRALSFSSRDNDCIPLACAYLSLGDLNTRQKNYKKAIEFLNKGMFYSRLTNYRVQWEEAYNLLSVCYESTGDHAAALAFLKKRNEIKDSILTEKAHQDVTNMMIKYETQKKDEQISILNNDSRNKQNKIRIAVFIILGLLSVAALVAYLVWMYFRKKLMPKVRDMNLIQEKINIVKEGDNRKLRALYNVLPPELRPSPILQIPEGEMNTELMAQLESLLINDKIYLDENLTLAETARKLDTNTSYLSRLINEHYQVNFSTFLNNHRIEEAKKMILDDKFNNFSMEGIARSAGFRSKSTFNQVFKNSTGLTPTGFAVQHGKVRTLQQK